MANILQEDCLDFPHPDTCDKQGLLAIGGDLQPERLLRAYQQGIFPWFSPGHPILWWSPNPRLILDPRAFKASKSLQKSMRKPFRLTIDSTFERVINACASNPGRNDNTWITAEMIAAYIKLHELGYAHSFELWLGEELVGGLYGISLGGAFFGESMFHRCTDASKITLFHLCQILQKQHFDFIDCQLPTTHLFSLGATAISRREFLYRLSQSLQKDTQRGSWSHWCLPAASTAEIKETK